MKTKDCNLIKVGQQIRELRECKGLSQEAFASVAGLDRSYMGGIERGERNISVKNLIRVAKALNVEIGGLFPSIHALV